jgi:hypothetical protein
LPVVLVADNVCSWQNLMAHGGKIAKTDGDPRRTSYAMAMPNRSCRCQKRTRRRSGTRSKTVSLSPRRNPQTPFPSAPFPSAPLLSYQTSSARDHDLTG